MSEAENEKAIASERQARAEVEGRKAELARARLNLDYATVRAPIDGVVGAALVSEGALVGAERDRNLATIQQLDLIYADFTQSVTELNQLRRALDSGDLDRIEADAAKVQLMLDDDTIYPLNGKLLFSDAKVDANTGQVTLRGEFRNPKRELLPGMYVRVRIDQGIDSDAIAVPQQAIQRNGGGASEVFVVKDDNRIAVQPVRTGSVQDGVLVRHRRAESRRQGRGRRLPEICGRRPGQVAILDQGGCFPCNGQRRASGAVTHHVEFLHRQADLRLGRCAVHLPDRRYLDSAAAGRAISDHRAAIDLDLDQLSRRLAGKPLQ